MKKIGKVAVFGSGVMGASIAAHITNAGIPVILLDIVPEGAEDRNILAKTAIKKLLKSDPEAFMHPSNAALITPANIEDDMHRLAECDWILEAIIEDIKLKRRLYKQIQLARKPGSIVSSNTSTIPLGDLVKGMPKKFSQDFLITHFFNPPRYLRLFEMVAGPDTKSDALEMIRSFADRKLGKSVVNCHDTPGFIGNRIGIFWLQCAVAKALDDGVPIEAADAALSRPCGIPKTGVFGLLDMVGLDLMPRILSSMKESLPPDDPFHSVNRDFPLLDKMIADGYTGRKGKGGFYRLKPDTDKKIKEAINLTTGDYAKAQKPKLESVQLARKKGLKAFIGHPDQAGQYAGWVLLRVLAYAASLVPEIADDILSVDEAMRQGYNWKYGPFELIDQLGTGWFRERLQAEGIDVPPLIQTAGNRSFYRTHRGQRQYLDLTGDYRDFQRPDGILLLADIKHASKPVARNMSANLWDIGDGVLCLEFTSKMNSLNPFTLSMIRKAIKLCQRRYRALVIYNEGSNFSVGANVGLLLGAMKIRAWFAVRYLIKQGQETFDALKHAPFPVVGAPSGMALGGGCEILLHCDAIQAHAETYSGLVETGIGVIPGWGGCKEMLFRWSQDRTKPRGPMPPVINSFEMIATAKVAKSAAQAQEMLILRDGDGITMNRDRLLADAKARALAMVDDYRPPEPANIYLPGETARAALEMAVEGFKRMGLVTAHDSVVAKHLGITLSGGDTDHLKPVSGNRLLELERDQFVSLARMPASQDRVSHILKTGRPLRN
ncbi:3-hydroxyacyl-CoA dehydrogenase/enoyl-CoA hydratase family protein [Aestuariispira insulae]|uniref:3-hydroxyacyl-CoA dehydrogenase n=1 Tax=Aestuariispira insulae TaxID=1461337 RepID=A0A3D9HML5_9PROT|nr:3-hydroxyacyl-CoA dehydrogenase/enoyl-CoA hydratase family protein [Aestuariispira insulae]RED50747.1 3-hydroxyacyl-CoA dehydrogenase [Aestuariispira insulae]